MAIYLSASLLNDYISCSRKVYYRINHSYEAVQDSQMVMGEIVHKALELHYDNYRSAMSFLASEVESRFQTMSNLDFCVNCYDVYWNNFRKYLNPNDLVETKFKIPIEQDVYMVGKIDRISDRKVFDWKTERRPPSSVSDSIQFIIYNWAYKKLNGVFPSGVYYASLTSGALIRYSVNEASESVLFNEVIPNAITAIKSKEYSRNGIFRKACYKCSYSGTCLEEFNVVDSATSNKE